MSSPFRFRRRSLRAVLPLALAAACAAIVVPAVAGPGRAEGTVFTMTNATNGNQVVAFERFADGRLGAQRRFDTRGTGTGAGLGNQGALALSDSGAWLLAVNPGSDSVSVFLNLGGYLFRTDTEASGGTRPVSVAIENDVVYVLNTGSDSLQGFRLTIYGKLVPIAGARRALDGTGTGAAQVGFNRDGDLLAVTEKATNRVLTYVVRGDGLLGPAHVTASPTPTPFGFAFGRRDQLLVSEAAGGVAGRSTLSAYALGGDGAATVVSPAVPSGQNAACWVVSTRDGRFAYVANAGSAGLSSYRLAGDGSAALLRAVAGSTGNGSGPTDLAVDPDSRFLYALSPRDGAINAFAVGADGALAPIAHAAAGLPTFATGIVAR
ncbi:MAG: lactonase family protein [Lysobacteraceae bacterium]